MSLLFRVVLSLMSDVAIKMQNLSKDFDSRLRVLQSISLDVPKGDFISILGPSGCGKSTLLRTIAGLEIPTSGTLQIADGLKLSFVFQDAHLLPWRTVLKNAVLPLELENKNIEAHLRDVKELLARLGLSEFLNYYPHQLSGGMKMRVSIARALMTRPDILLLDEPFAALDEMTRFSLDQDLRDLWARHKTTILFVTHSLSEALFLSQRILVMSKRPGQLLSDHKIDLPLERTSKTKATVEYAQQLLMLTEEMEAAR